MSSWNIVKKTPSVFFLLIHGLFQTFLDSFSRCSYSSSKEAPKHCTTAPSPWFYNLNVNSVIIFIKLREIFSGYILCVEIIFTFFVELWIKFYGTVPMQKNYFQNKLTQIYMLCNKNFFKNCFMYWTLPMFSSNFNIFFFLGWNCMKNCPRVPEA